MSAILDLVPRDAAKALGDWLAARGEPAYRLQQILPRLWQQPVARWADASNLPASLRQDLDSEWPLGRLTLAVRQDSTDGTAKFLWRLPDGEAIEAVLIPEGARRTLCISSQAGCPLQCAFCATGTMGLNRNLAAWEIAAQVREMLLLAEPVKPTNVVFMGMGEPLVNWEAVGPALTILNDPEGFGIGARHITVSTVGILPGIAELAKRPEQFRLAISLHAPTSETRLSIMPIEKRYPLAKVLAAAKRFTRRVTFEYVLIGDVNDRDEDLAALAIIAKESGALVNLLPLHPGGAPGLKPSPTRRMYWFASALRRRGVEAVLRRSRGLDIDAACGQLRIASAGDQAREVPSQPDGDVHQAAGVRRRAHRARA
ncbi:MAG: 23S rRNA (adenine(2503)-C(2))-methyltransferase RlmN [Gemmatimonadota bacterium]|jgi:23S rRNA (adenine2503-C2)-methyltransferase